MSSGRPNRGVARAWDVLTAELGPLVELASLVKLKMVFGCREVQNLALAADRMFQRGQGCKAQGRRGYQGLSTVIAWGVYSFVAILHGLSAEPQELRNEVHINGTELGNVLDRGLV